MAFKGACVLTKRRLDWKPMRHGLLAMAFAISACASSIQPASSEKPSVTFEQTGDASWYGPGFAGRKTANGEIFDPTQLTCAHRKLKFGTKVRVTNLSNGKSVVVRVNDRGPYAKGRIIDLSHEAAKRIDMVEKGHAKVRVEAL